MPPKKEHDSDDLVKNLRDLADSMPQGSARKTLLHIAARRIEKLQGMVRLGAIVARNANDKAEAMAGTHPYLLY